MNQKLQEECKDLIKRYQSYKHTWWKVKVRNELYEKTKPWMLIWIKSILGLWGKWEEPEEILSLSWDAFMFCLEKHNGSDVHPPKYFFEFTRYFLLSHYASKGKVTLSLDELNETLSLVPDELNERFTSYLTLCQFIESIPEEHRLVVNDSIHSLFPGRDERMWSWEKGCGISRQAYCELKKAYVVTIKWILYGNKK